MSTITPAKTASARIKQSLSLIFQNWKVLLTIPFILFLILGITGLIFKKMGIDLEAMQNNKELPQGIPLIKGILSFILIIGITVLGNIIVTLATIFSISEIDKGNQVNLEKVFNYAVEHFKAYFNVVWTVFKYIAFIPMLIILGAGVLMLFSMISYFNTLLPNNIAGLIALTANFLFIIGVGWALLAFFNKGPYAFAALYIAVDQNTNAQNALASSLEITKNKWGRTFGNSVLSNLTAFLINFIFGIIIGIFGISTITGNDFTIRQIITLLINNISPTISLVFPVVFLYLLYKTYVNENLAETKN